MIKAAFLCALAAVSAASPLSRIADLAVLSNEKAKLASLDFDSVITPPQDIAESDGSDALSYIVVNSFTDPMCADYDGIFSSTGTLFGNDCEPYSNETNPLWNSFNLKCDDANVPFNASFYNLVVQFFESDNCTGPANFTGLSAVPTSCDPPEGDFQLYTRMTCVNSNAPWEDAKDGVTSLFYESDNEQCGCQESYGMFYKMYTGVCVAFSEDSKSQEVTGCSEANYNLTVYPNAQCAGDNAAVTAATLAACDVYTGMDDYSASSQFCEEELPALCDPTAAPTTAPTAAPTVTPSAPPSASPTAAPSESPTVAPTASPTEAGETNAPSAAPTTRQDRASNDDDSSGLTGGEVAGIVIGVMAGVAIVGAVGYYLVSAGILSGGGPSRQGYDGMADNLL